MFSSCVCNWPKNLVRTGNLMRYVDVYNASVPGPGRRKSPDEEGQQDA